MQTTTTTTTLLDGTTLTNLNPEQMMADVKLLRALAAGARIPHHIMCDVVQPTKEPWVCNCGAEERQKRLDEALAATDRPEYREEG